MRPDWASGRTRGTVSAVSPLSGWFMALFWNAFCAGIVWFMFLSQKKQAQDIPVIFKGIFGIGFPIIGLFFLAQAMAATRRALRYGRSWLTFDAVPATPGGVLSGRIDCAVREQLEPTFLVTLACIESYATGPAKHRVERADRLWHAEYECRGEPSATVDLGSLVPVRFQLPADAKPCGEGARGTIAWMLTARASLVGVDYVEEFAIPVYAGAPREPMVERAPRPAPPPEQRPSHGKLALERDGDALRVTFPAAMNPKLAMIPLAFLAVAGWMAYAYVRAGAWYWAVLPGLVAALALIGAVRAWLMRTTLTVRRGEIAVDRSILGFTSTTTYAAADLDVAAAMDFQAGTSYMSKLKIGSGDKKVEVGSLIGNDAELDQVSSAIRAKLRG
jgi:hypothetical protein